MHASIGLCADVSSRVPNNPLHLGEHGEHTLHILSPTLLELALVTAKPPDPQPPPFWDWIDNNRFEPPPTNAIVVTANGERIAIQAIGFKRRPFYAPLHKRDLRLNNHLYLELARPLSEGDAVEVRNPDRKLWPTNWRFAARMDPLRWSPAVHVNHLGYLPGNSKKAMVGYFCGSLGEMSIAFANGFKVVEASSGKVVHAGTLTHRPDEGFGFLTYEKVYEADFTAFNTPGEYRLMVPGIGASYPFFIDDGIAAGFARAYALGLYHQRCGAANELPFTRFVHGPCHTAPAAVPDATFKEAEKLLADNTIDAKHEPRHTARRCSSFATSLYPFVRRGKVEVAGGHHDAGDYSKYTINSAHFIHCLVFAADNFPGVADLDNLGLPESGDGRSDVLQIAKWEADFLAKMQDSDGGFYTLVYPRERAYENNVLPDQGDPQVVWPKTTVTTAAAVAALAQTASSAPFKRQFPEAASNYLARALTGWSFLTNAFARHGKDGSYQRVYQYGDVWIHDDEIAWAACELFLATGDPAFQERLMDAYNPADPNTRRWNWWRLFEGYGNAARSYACAVKSGRAKKDQLNPFYLVKCENEIETAGRDVLGWARQSAYGTSFPEPSKRFKAAAWYFSSDPAFDLAVALALDYPERNDPRPEFLEALLSNLNYLAGCNPVNVSFLTGVGWQRPRDIVHHYAMNDRRVLPPGGLSVGNIVAGFHRMDQYGSELSEMTFPHDDTAAPYPFYDRWTDSFNLGAEFVSVNGARALACAAFLMARTPVANQKWAPVTAAIRGISSNAKVGETFTLAFDLPETELKQARVVWEASDAEPFMGSTFAFIPQKPGTNWIEAEAVWLDGRRVVAVTNILVKGRSAAGR